MLGRVLAAAEENSKMEQANLEKLELDVRKLQQELDRLNREKISLQKDLGAAQQRLQGKRCGGGGGGGALSSVRFFFLRNIQPFVFLQIWSLIIQR